MFNPDRPVAHHAAGADPLPVGDLGERRVEAVDVVRRGARVAAEQLSAIFTNSAELHVVVVLLHVTRVSVVLLTIGAVFSGFPLDALLFLQSQESLCFMTFNHSVSTVIMSSTVSKYFNWCLMI